MARLPVPLFALPILLLLMATTLTGLNTRVPLAAPWTDPAYCGIPDTNYTLCDPDHLYSRTEGASLEKLLDRCRNEAVLEGLKVVVFVAADVTFHEDAKAAKKGGDEGSPVDRLRDLVVDSYSLASSSSPVLLLVVIKKPYQIALWQSEALRGKELVGGEDLRKVQNNTHHYEHFPASVVHAAHYLCQKVKETYSIYSEPRYIILTVTAICFSLLFFSLIVVMGVFLGRARRYALRRKNSRSVREAAESRLSQHIPPASPSDLHDLGVACYRSTGHVLLGSSDITAAAQNCSSTDNLLQA